LNRSIENQRLLELAESVAGIGRWRMDLVTRRSLWSDAVYAIYGVDRETFEPGLPGILTLCDPADRGAISCAVASAVADASGFEIEFKVNRPDGEARYVLAKAVCELGDNGAPTALFGVIQDITPRVLVLEELRQQIRLAKEQTRREELAEQVAGVGHWRLDVATNAVTWSTQMYQIYGLVPDAPLDLARLLAMTHPDDREAGSVRLARALAVGADGEASLARIRRPDGELRYIRGKMAVERHADGSILAVVGTLLDVTEYRLMAMEADRARESYKLLADNANDLILQCSLDGRVAFASPSSLRLTGYPPEEIVGRMWCDLIFPDDSEQVRGAIREQAKSGVRCRSEPLEYRFVHREGHIHWFEGVPTLVFDPETSQPTGFTSIIRDITARKATEAELREARLEAEAATAAKSEFLANMSHELRTPLTSIIGFTKLAVEQPELGDLTRTYLERVTNASEALLCTVNDVLDFSKLEAGQVAFQCRPTDFCGLARRTLDPFSPQAGAKDLALSLKGNVDDLVISVDPDRIRQILLNLVGNAVKFTASGGVTLRTHYEAGQLTVEVVDTGDGIPTDREQVLFQRFSQIDGSLTRAHGGTGLGLAICKGLVEAMGGQIGVDSALGRGSRFWFTIPAAMAILPAASDGTAAVHMPVEGVRVLVVDDHPTNRKLATLFLAGVGAEVSEAVDGEEAVRMASQWPYDVVLMDIRMPKLDGPGALRAIRETPGPNDAIPILAFTADSSIASCKWLSDQGFQGVVTKPLEPGAFLRAIAEATAYDGLEAGWGQNNVG
jgi:PAS domain S-box-containing protein